MPVLPLLLLILLQSEAAVRSFSAKKVFKFCKIHKKISKKGFRYRCFLVNFAKFLITPFSKNPSGGCFCINTRSVCCPTTAFRLFKNDVTNIFWLSIFSAGFVGWEQKWAQYLKPLARSLFSTQSNIWNWVFLAKIVSTLKPLGIFAIKAPL